MKCVALKWFVLYIPMWAFQAFSCWTVPCCGWKIQHQVNNKGLKLTVKLHKASGGGRLRQSFIFCTNSNERLMKQFHKHSVIVLDLKLLLWLIICELCRVEVLLTTEWNLAVILGSISKVRCLSGDVSVKVCWLQRWLVLHCHQCFSASRAP